jgi:hypothetical protein
VRRLLIRNVHGMRACVDGKRKGPRTVAILSGCRPGGALARDAAPQPHVVIGHQLREARVGGQLPLHRGQQLEQLREVDGALQACMHAAVIELRRVSQPLAFAGELRPPRLNNHAAVVTQGHAQNPARRAQTPIDGRRMARRCRTTGPTPITTPGGLHAGEKHGGHT